MVVPIMFFRSYKPPAPLSDFVENLWAYRGFESPRMKERILPSGTSELVFNLREDEMRIYKDSRSNEFQRYSGAIVSGPYAGPFVTDTALDTCVMGVHFKPGGAFPFLGFGADELRDRHADLQNDLGACGCCNTRAIVFHEVARASLPPAGAIPEITATVLATSQRGCFRACRVHARAVADDTRTGS